MLIAGAGRLCLPVLLLVTAVACRPAGDARPAVAADAAVPSYTAPDGAPDFCTRLASVGELTRLPASIGRLVAGTDVEARTQVSGVMQELRTVLSDVRDAGGHGELATALDDLVRALRSAVDGPLTDPVRGAVTAGLEQVGAQAQPACRYPA